MLRTFHAPSPAHVRVIDVWGPARPEAVDAHLDGRALDEALTLARALDRSLGSDGWCVIWCLRGLHDGARAARTLWIERSSAGEELQVALAAALDALRFSVRRVPGPTTLEHPGGVVAAYVRVGARAVGLDATTGPLWDLARVVPGARDDGPDRGLALAALLGELESAGALPCGWPPPDARPFDGVRPGPRDPASPGGGASARPGSSGAAPRGG